jgi:hypothetical protein
MAKTNKAKSTGSTGQTIVKDAYGLANRISAQAKAKANDAANTGTGVKNTGTNTGQTVSTATQNTAQNPAQNTQNTAQDVQQYIQSYVPSVDFMSVYNDYASRMNNILQQQKDALNQQTTSQAKAAYVANEQNKVEIPRTLSNAGVSGGLAEKIRTNQNTSYQKNLADIFSQRAAQNAEYEKNNANLISEAYKEAMSNQQSVENERALAAQQYANQLALQQQQQVYEEQQAKTDAADAALNAALSGGFSDIYDSKGKFKTSASSQMSSVYNQQKANGASQAALDNFEHAMIIAAQNRYYNNPDNRKEKLTWKEYKQKYVGDRIGKTY